MVPHDGFRRPASGGAEVRRGDDQHTVFDGQFSEQILPFFPEGLWGQGSGPTHEVMDRPCGIHELLERRVVRPVRPSPVSLVLQPLGCQQVDRPVEVRAVQGRADGRSTVRCQALVQAAPWSENEHAACIGGLQVQVVPRDQGGDLSGRHGGGNVRGKDPDLLLYDRQKALGMERQRDVARSGKAGQGGPVEQGGGHVDSLSGGFCWLV